MCYYESMKKVLVGLLVVGFPLTAVLISLHSHKPVEALTCTADERTPLQQMREADAVFYGTVIGDAEESEEWLIQNVRVEITAKGPEEGLEIPVFSYASWSHQLEDGGRYVMLLSQEKGRLVRGLCETSTINAGDNMDEAETYLKHFEQIKEESTPDPRFKLTDDKTRLFAAGGIIIAGIGYITVRTLKSRSSKRSAE